MDSKDRDGPVKMLALNGDLISFQLSSCVSKEKEQQRAVELHYTLMLFQKDCRTFSVKCEGNAVVKKGSSTEVTVVSCASVEDVRNGQTVLCILLRQSRKKSMGFKYVVLMFYGTNHVQAHMEFKLPYELMDNVTILRGPTVLWRHEGITCYTSLEVCEVRQVPVQLSSVIFTGELPFRTKNKIILLGSRYLEGPDDKVENAWEHQTIGYFLDDGKLFDGAQILPHAYSAVLKCVYFLVVEDKGASLKSVVVGATNRKQLVWFENGIPGNVCSLPFEEPKHISMVNTGQEGSFFVIYFEGGNVCSIWKDSLQVVSCWEGVTFMLVDDFVGCGTEQLLLLFDSQPADTMLSFILTDMCEITYSTRDADMDTDSQNGVDTHSENFLLTIQALEARLQNGRASLQDLQRSLEVKSRVVQHSLQALADVIAGVQHVPCAAEQEGLVPLWDEDEEGESQVEAMLVTPSALSAPVDKIWLRVIGECLVVGVRLTTKADLSAETLSLSLVLESSPNQAAPVLQTKSRVLDLNPPKLNAYESHLEPPAKKKKADADTPYPITVVAVTELTPILACGNLKCAIMLNVIHQNGDNVDGNDGRPEAYGCGSVELNMQDILQDKYSLQLLNNCTISSDDHFEDFVSLLAVSESWSFLIRSPHYTLCDISRWLLSAMACERVAAQPEYFLSGADGVSPGTLFLWREISQFEGKLKVHCRSQLKLLQVLDSLCQYLLPSCEIQPIRGQGIEELSLTVASSMEMEVVELRKGLTTLFREEHGRRMDIHTTDATSELERWQAEVEKDKGRRGRVRIPLVDVAQYRKVISTVSKAQIQSDVAVQMLCGLCTSLKD